MDDKQHPDSIWTWTTSARRGRAAIWVPYLQSVERIKGGWALTYNGGRIDLDPKDADSILIYGATGSLPVPFLDDLARHRVPLMIHRRNLDDPYIFVPGARRDDADILSAQIRARDNQTKCAYVARSLIRERFKATRFPVPASFYQALARQRSVEAARQMEAEQSRQYWAKYFSALGLADWGRRHDNPVSAALDAGSFFLYGIVLRWVLMHRLSPAHGYLHVTTGYPSLAYDLMEPYRAWIEDTVFDLAARAGRRADEGGPAAASPDPGRVWEGFTEKCLARLKDAMDEQVYLPSHRAIARRKNLLHGAVLALRSWLLGKTRRLVLPVEGPKLGGRKPKQGYRLPGAQPAPTAR